MEIYKDFLRLLPSELKFKILSYLDLKDLLSATQVSKDWYTICNDNFLWREICIKEQICTNVGENDTQIFKSNRKIDSEISFWKMCYIRQCNLEKSWRSRQTNSFSKVIEYNAEMIGCIQINEKYLVSASLDAVINVFLINTGENFKKLLGHRSGVILLKLLDNIIVSGDGDGIIKIWNIENGQCIFNLNGHTARISCLSVYKCKLVSGSCDFSLRFWNFETGNCLKVFNGHTAAVRCTDYNGTFVISGSSDKTVKIWNTNTGECIKTLEGHRYDVVALSFDGLNIVSASIGAIYIWNAETGSIKNNLMGCKDCFAFKEKNDLISNKNMFAFINVLYSPNPFVRFKYDIKICDFATGEYLQTITEECSQVKCMQFVLNFVLTSTYGSTIKLWDIKSGKFIRNLININWHEDGYYVHGFRANETKLVVLTQSNTYKNKIIIINFDFQCKGINFMRSTMQNHNCSVT
ncbi:F-box/WD repeat-containing protein 7-like isoform X2 [Condylostylus longicornis]|uniref:F-box/WD repeat-containing protein 7-like isoform X2 n=1 Tax=Condylostylus longicornis TaxID=2530218 RepID=UPI00244E1DFE|nr:F-box/WD repeat-containing protein 7-like isoform X2 [Condylostylus longicornis]